MNPLTHLLLAAALFLATHYIASTPLRAKLAAALGNAYLGLYTLVAFATLGYMIWAYYRAPFFNLWYAAALRYVPLIIMPFALLLAVCGLLTRNPTLVGQERLLKAGEPARGILRVTRHPLMWGFALWAASHIMARGDAAGIIFFGTFLLLALSGTVLIDRRKAAALGDDWRRYAAVTSNIPFAAIAAGRNRFKPGEIGWLKPAVALAFYGLLLWQHANLFGGHPLFQP
jgi:uncharacterized membrane protein